MAEGGARFVDPGTTLTDLAHDVLVRCPRCDARATVRNEAVLDGQRSGAFQGLHAPHRLACGACAHVSRWFGGKGSSMVFGEPVDPWLRLPLWLAAPHGSHTVWAYNEAHLALLEAFVASSLRVHGTGMGDHPTHQTVIGRLPAWWKDPHARDALGRVLRRLRASLGD